MTPRRMGKKRRIKIGIRPQLIFLVGFASLFSLLVLAIVIGIYFLLNLSSLRAERLSVISQLKAAQVKLSIQYINYQVYWLSTKDSVTTPLSNYKAGNNSAEVFTDSQSALDLFLTSSDTFAAARLYDLDLKVVAELTNNASIIPDYLEPVLYPLAENVTVPLIIFTSSNSSSDGSLGYITGPIANATYLYLNTTYYYGITLPIHSNSSIILDEVVVSGYLTVIANAATIQTALAYLTNSTNKNTYTTVVVKSVFNNDTLAAAGTDPVGFEAVFPIDGYIPQEPIQIDSDSAAFKALSKSGGTATNIKSSDGKSLAIGFTRIQLDSATYWTVIIEQSRKDFLAPTRKLTSIMIGVVIGIGVFMCLITFPLAVWFVVPITKLKEATEAITRSKKQKEGHMALLHSPRAVSPFTSEKDAPLLRPETHTGKRNSVNSASTSSSTVYSTGIRLPGRIPQSKKLFKDELTELSDAFNIMTEELEKQYSHLEDRVRTRTKELESSKIEAEAANEAKTVFIANISHELRTPLNGILGMTSVAMAESENPRTQDSLKLIHRSGELLLHILTELLTYSKNTLNRAKLEKSNFQVLEILYQVRSIFGKLALDQRVNLKITLKPNILRKLILFGDSNRIIQVVMNLVSNSLKFTPVDGSVEVTFRLLGEYDFEKSRESDFEKVCVLDPNSGEETEDDQGEDLNTPEEDINDFGGFFRNAALAGKRKKSAPSIIRNETNSMDSDVQKELDASDSHSIATLATQEYENNIFQSQFLYMKPLPHAPLIVLPASSPHVDLKYPPFDPHYQDLPPPSASFHTESIPMTGLAPTAGTDGSKPPRPISKGPLPLPKVPTPMSTTSNFSDSRQPSSTQGFGTNQISTSELVKNNKVYKMRKLYSPKTWVLQVVVLDTGSGIEPALQEKVFEPFIQGDQTLSRTVEGTGLGLSICRQLAKMMNGSLTLKSTIGKGSTFTFTVPLPQNGEILVPPEQMEEFSNDEFNPNSRVNRKVAFDIAEGSVNVTPTVSVDPASPSVPKSPKSPRKHNFTIEMPKNNITRNHLMNSSTGSAITPTGESLLENLSHLKIMVAEDNSVNQEVIKRMLKLEGFSNITMAFNGAEAVDLVKASLDTTDHYDIIFMDVQMPKMDGLTATKLIRHNLKFRKPIIALTAFADESNMKECLNSGMSGFLSKPIKRTNLRQIITEFSSDLLSDFVTTPITYIPEEDRRLGFGNSPAQEGSSTT